MLIPAGYAAAVITGLAPFLYMLFISFIDAGAVFSGEGASFTLSNYAGVISGESIHFIACLRNSLVISFISSFVTVITASLAAYAVARLSFKGKTAVLVGVLCLSLFPQISIAGYIFKLLSATGFINTYAGLIAPYTAWSLPLALWILTSYFASIPADMDMAAEVDGANHFQILYYIVFPVAAPGIVTAFLITFIFTLNEFLFALMFTVDYTARTVPVAIALFTGMHGEIPWGDIMAASAVTTAPVIILAAVFQKRIIQGLTGGSVK